MTPAYKITADGENVTGRFQDRLESLSVTDNDGEEADRLEISIDDRDHVVAWPETGAILELYMGFRETGLTYMGRFAADGVSGQGFPWTMTVSATAADMTSGVRAPRTATYKEKTLRQIVSEIAERSGLSAVVGPSIADTFFPHEIQSAESDLHFLRRLARPLDAVAKPAAGRLVLVRRGEGVNAEGAALPRVGVSAGQITAISYQLKEREQAGTVEAEWSETDTAITHIERVGDGDPIERMRHVSATKDEAKRRAEGRQRSSQRRALTMDIELASFAPGLFSGGEIALSGVRPGLNGPHLIKRVRHELSGALTTSISTERLPT